MLKNSSEFWTKERKKDRKKEVLNEQMNEKKKSD